MDDHELFRAGLRALLEGYPEFEVVGEATDARAAYAADEQLRPDVTLMDIRLPGTDGIAATRELKRRDPRRKIAMLSALDNPDLVVESLQAGASGFFLKSQAVNDAVIALRKIASGGTYVPPDLEGVVEEQSRRLARRRADRPFDLLSAREKEVFRLLIRGRSNSQVATELCLSVKTVETHREHILKKLGLHSVVELVRFAAREQLL